MNDFNFDPNMQGFNLDTPMFQNPWGDWREISDQIDTPMFQNPWGDWREISDQIDTMSSSTQGFNNTGFMFKNPYSNGLTFDEMHDFGLVSDQDYAFINSMVPKHETIDYSRSTSSHHENPIGPSKEEWARFDQHEAARAEAVDKYNECIKKGELDEADKWADKAVKEQYAKEAIYDVQYVTDVNKRAGLY